jgi:hypothetical protein
MSDKRTVTTDALETLGSVITANEKRDAIHLAVEPAIAAHVLHAGMDVGFAGFTGGEVGVCDNPVGIVDPFLKGSVQPGERFWLVVYPRQITSLRHVWTHPAFPESEVESAPASTNPYDVSRLWIENFAASFPIGYAMLMQSAADWVRSKEAGGWGEYLVLGGLLEGETVPDEFWTHYEIVTGKPVEEKLRGSFFSCSC